MNCETCCFKSKKLGFSLGLVWGVFVVIIAWIAGLTQFAPAVNFVSLLGHTYVGYEATLLGGLIGGVWGFIALFLFGWLVAKVYNCCCGCCRSASDCCQTKKKYCHHDEEKNDCCDTKDKDFCRSKEQ